MLPKQLLPTPYLPKSFFVGIFISAFLSSTTLSLATLSLKAHGSIDLEAGFSAPPKSAAPQTWFHAMSGNMSKVGITKDLEAIANVGIKGAMLFNVAQGVPYGKVKFASDDHLDMIAHMAKESKRLGLEFGMHNCDGWTSSAGPWIQPKHSMKKVVWTETLVRGGKVQVTLPQAKTLGGYYEDIALIAYPALVSELHDRDRRPKVSSSQAGFDTSIVFDGSVEEMSEINASEGSEGWVQFSYEQPFTLRSVEIFMHLTEKAEFTLMTSDDGKNFTEAAKFKTTDLGKRKYVVDPIFDGITAKHFRFVTYKPFRVREASLKSTLAIKNYLSRSSRGKMSASSFAELSEPSPAFVLNSNQVINLSARMNSSGEVNAELPSGNWTLMRFGFGSTGAKNHPASEEGRGLEVDKFSREAFKVHYDEFLKRVLNKVNSVAPGVFKYIEIDSYEVGGQNWTQGYHKKFSERFDYDLIPFLPLYAGRYVNSAKESELVMSHIRALNSDLMVNNYYKYFDELANADGITTYTEPYGNGPFNDLDAAAHADIPMGEFWLKGDNKNTAPIVSAAHINNKLIASAEGFTAKKHINWSFHPGMAKIDGDIILARGVNELVFHRFAHQANTHVMPGMTMGYWGANLDRTQAWWDISVKPWVENITRSQFLLRQGLPSTDLLLFVGDGHPSSCPNKRHLKPKLPNYLNYDCVSPDVLHTRFKAKRGRLVLPEGTSYKALYLTNHAKMTLQTLKKINALSKGGVVVVGRRPQMLLATDFKQQHSLKAQANFNKLVDAIWSRPSTYTTGNWKAIFAKHDINFGFKADDKAPLEYARRVTPREEIFFIVNNSEKAGTFKGQFDVQGKIPELWNPITGAIQKVAQFKQKGSTTLVPLALAANDSTFVVFRHSSKGVPHVLNLESTSERAKAQTHVFLNTQSELQLYTKANDSFQITLDSGKQHKIEVDTIAKPQVIDGKWKVRFDPTYGYGETLYFQDLIDWKDHPKDDIKYYSGKATYSNTFVLDENSVAKDKRVHLDLGKVSVSADVVINGEHAGTAWAAPYQLDVTEHIRLGKNAITITVANAWTNRLIGDKRFPETSGFKQTTYLPPPTDIMPEWYVNNEPPPPGKRLTFATHQFYEKGDPLASSGLMGPVKITTSIIKKIAIK